MKNNWSLKGGNARQGKSAIVTGANSGLGFETTKAFASKKIAVVMACRNVEKGEKAKDRILQKFPAAELQVMKLDLASLASVRDFASTFKVAHQKLDILINNAGVMMPPYELTEAGFELQLVTNYLGHFLLTGLLLPVLEKSTESARVVSLSSLAHRWGTINFNDLQSKRHYDRTKAYGQSKLACLLFAYELERRLVSAGKKSRSFAAHPGLSATNLAQHISGFSKLLLPFLYPFSQSAEKGALPQIRAALDPHLKGGEYLGPSGWFECRGNPVIVDSSKLSKDLETGEKLWRISEGLTEISYL